MMDMNYNDTSDPTPFSFLAIKSYSGETNQDGIHHGNGVALFHSDCTYEGQFSNGYMQGKGKLTWKNGIFYEGDFEKNKLTGSGTYSWRKDIYKGELINSVINGHGKFEHRDSNYAGQWKDGKTHGEGKICFDKSGNYFYNGQWKNGMKNGSGVMLYRSGNSYNGEWKDNVRHGKGKMIWKTRLEEYSGEWKNGIPDGSGTYIWGVKSISMSQFPMENQYSGKWVNGKRCGYGVYTYASGASYKGEWKDNMKHGVGVYVFENGRIYSGLFENDKMVDSFEEFKNDCPFQFAAESENSELLAVNKIIFRYLGDLRSLYANYCPNNQNGLSKAMRRSEIWAILKTCKIREKGVSLVDFNRAFAKRYENSYALTHLYKNPHDSSEIFIFHRMIEYLLSCAVLLYENRKDLSRHETGKSACLSYFLKFDIFPLAHGFNNVELNSKAALEKKIFTQFENDFTTDLTNIYEGSAVKNLKSLKDSNDNTITIRQFLLLLKTLNLINAEKYGFHLNELLTYISRQMPYILENNSFNFEHEILICDFIDYIFQIFKIFNYGIFQIMSQLMVDHKMTEYCPKFDAEKINTIFKEIAILNEHKISSIQKANKSRPASPEKDISLYHQLPENSIFPELNNEDKLCFLYEYLIKEANMMVKKMIENHKKWKYGIELIHRNIKKDKIILPNVPKFEIETQTSFIEG